MCGIAGYLNLGNNHSGDRQVLENMIQEIAHRGPDGQGFMVHELGGLGFCRLSIIDLPGGNQPFANEDGSVFVVGNGEILGYRRIREELLNKGHTLTSHCDIEVLVHLYEEEGSGFFNKLRGQFAFVIMDTRKQSFYLVRDQFGVCPLFYTILDRQIIFASEIKAILQYPNVSRAINAMAVEHFFTLPGLVSPHTMFQNIYSLPPGQYLYAERNGKTETRAYWDVVFPQHAEGAYKEEAPEIVFEELEQLLINSVDSWMHHSDVEVGALLSGGLDSSLINALLRRLSPSQRKTYSVVLEQAEFNESSYQQMVTAQTGFQNHTIPFTVDDILPNIHQVIWHSECPIKETVNVALYKLSSAIKSNKMKVVLSGEGSDEIFAGYLGYLGDLAVMGSRQRSFQEGELCRNLWGDEMFKYDMDYSDNLALKRRLFSDDLYRKCAEVDFMNKPVVNLDKIAGLHPVNRRSYLDIKLRLPELLLINQHDHMFAANGIEARYPFLNVDLVEYCAQMHPSLKIRGTKQKYALKQIGQKHLPPAINKRQKFPFVTPGTPHILQKNPDFIRDILSRDTIKRQGYFNYETVEKLIEEYNCDDVNVHINYQSDTLFQVLSFTLFAEIFRVTNP